MREESQVLKKDGNQLYLTGSNEEAVEKYSLALDVCPLVFKDDRAVLLSNRAAAKIKLVSHKT